MTSDKPSSKPPAASSTPTGAARPGNPVLALMRRFNIPVTPENYLNLAYMGRPPAILSAEEELQLPPELRQQV
jgi:hypothetical protein